MKILVTGAGALLGQGIIRSLELSKLDTEIIAVDPSALSAGLYWAQRRHLIPMATDPHYLDRMREILAQDKPDVVLLGTDVELLLFAEHRTELEAEFHTKILVSSPKVVGIADDKYETFRFLRDKGFAYPKSCLPGEEAELLRECDFPLIVKPRVGARSVGVHLVRNTAELERAVAAVHEPVIQECVADASEEYTAGALVFDGACRATIVMRRDLRDGNTYRAFVDHYPELNEEVRRMAEALDPYGPANFQFRLDAGRVKVFEINGRFSGTTPLRAHAGFNEVELCLRHLVLGEPITQPAVAPLTILRHWSEVVVRPKELVTA